MAGALAGCAVTRNQLDAATAFAQSTSTLGTSAQNAYSQAAAAEATLTTEYYIAHATPQAIKNDDYIKPRIALARKKIPGRYAAAAALAAYGHVLTTLLDSKTQESDLASATSAFTGALKSIPAKTLKDAGIKAAQITNVGNLITSFGDIYLEVYREKVLRQVVPKAEPIVKRLCTLFANDFGKKKPLFRVMYSNEINDVLRFTEKALKKRPKNLESRAILLPIYQKTKSIQSHVMPALTSVNAAAKSCVSTSVVFARSISDPSISPADVVDFAKKSRAAYDAVMATTKH